MQALEDSAKYIKIAGSGKNALDFHIAYYIGELAENEPEAFFILSLKILVLIF